MGDNPAQRMLRIANAGSAQMVIDERLRDLAGITENGKASATPLFRQRIQRWKEVTTDILRREISNKEADRFASIPILPRALTGDTLTDTIKVNEAFLVALSEAIAQDPHIVFPDAERAQRQGSAPLTPEQTKPAVSEVSSKQEVAHVSAPHTPPIPSPAGLQPPEKVTLPWLFHHVDWSVWFSAALALTTAFLVGYRLGVAGALKPLLAAIWP
jgi:hypothetical protein